MPLPRLKTLSAYVAAIGGPTYTDAYIEHWGEVYARNTWLSDVGVTFELFLLAPVRLLHRAPHKTLMPAAIDEFYPLLPAQRAVQAQIDAEQPFPNRRCHETSCSNHEA